MALWCKKPWELQIDRDMTCVGLHGMTGLSVATFAKMVKGECVASFIIDSICTSSKCDIGDIMEAVPGKNTAKFL